MAEIQESAEAGPELNAYLDEKSADILNEVALEPDPSERSLEEVAGGEAYEEAPAAEPVKSLGRGRNAGGDQSSSEEVEMAQYLTSLKQTDPAAAADVLRQLANTYDTSGGGEEPAPEMALDEWLGVDPEDLDGVTRAVAQSVLNQHNYMGQIGKKLDGINARIDTQSQAATESAQIEQELERVQGKYGLEDGDMDVIVDEMESRGLSDVEGSAAMLILEAIQQSQQSSQAPKRTTPSAPTRQITQPPSITQTGAQDSIIPTEPQALGDEYSMEDAFRDAARGLKQSGGY